MAAKSLFCHVAKTANYANLRKKGAAHIIFFSAKRCVTDI